MVLTILVRAVLVVLFNILHESGSGVEIIIFLDEALKDIFNPACCIGSSLKKIFP